MLMTTLALTALIQDLPENLEAHVRKLAGANPPRNFENVKSLDASADYIRSQFQSYGLKTEDQTFEANKGSVYRNILTSVGPVDAPRIVIGAHYDVCEDQPGADDNASGVAGMLEAARILQMNSKNLKNRIDFVAYTLEEPPFFTTRKMGSYVHAKSLHDAKADVRMMISVEMIGYYSDEPDSQRYPLPFMKLFFPDQGNFIALIGNLVEFAAVRDVRSIFTKHSSVPMVTFNAPAFIEGLSDSDHRNYRKFGYDALMLTNTGYMRTPHYHLPSDTPETLNYLKMAEVVKGFVAYLEHWAMEAK